MHRLRMVKYPSASLNKRIHIPRNINIIKIHGENVPVKILFCPDYPTNAKLSGEIK